MLHLLANSQSPQTVVVQAALKATGLRNVFNPSVIARENGYAVSFRALPERGQKPFHAFYMRLSKNGDPQGEIENLTERFGARIDLPVADPKLFDLAGETWTTFNTGHFEKPNTVYLARLTPPDQRLFRVAFSGRSEIEKNWAFFVQGGVLHALYNLSPLVILRETARTDGVITFEKLQMADPEPNVQQRLQSKRMPQLTIGTQLADLDGSGRSFALVGHRRFYWKGKRLYLGKALRLTLGSDGFALSQDRSYLAHSIGALFGSRVKHNANLLSCSYFSGLTALQDQLLVSYGINDIGFGLASVSKSRWPKLGHFQE